MADTTLQNYRLLLLVSPNISEAAFKAEVEKARKQIEQDKGDIKTEDLLGSRELAYSIKGHEKGYYAHLKFIAHADGLSNLQDSLKLNESILRFMITKD